MTLSSSYYREIENIKTNHNKCEKVLFRSLKYNSTHLTNLSCRRNTHFNNSVLEHILLSFLASIPSFFPQKFLGSFYIFIGINFRILTRIDLCMFLTWKYQNQINTTMKISLEMCNTYFSKKLFLYFLCRPVSLQFGILTTFPVPKDHGPWPSPPLQRTLNFRYTQDIQQPPLIGFLGY